MDVPRATGHREWENVGFELAADMPAEPGTYTLIAEAHAAEGPGGVPDRARCHTLGRGRVSAARPMTNA